MTGRQLITLLMDEKYDLDGEIRVEVEWTDYMAKSLPEEGLLYMPIGYMKQYDWGVVLELGSKE